MSKPIIDLGVETTPFADRIKAAGWSKETAATRLGISWRTAHRWFTGETDADPRVITLLDMINSKPASRRKLLALPAGMPLVNVLDEFGLTVVVPLSLPLPTERFTASELHSLIGMLGIAQTTFSEMCGVNDRTGRRWFNDTQDISPTADRLAKLLALEAIKGSVGVFDMLMKVAELRWPSGPQEQAEED